MTKRNDTPKPHEVFTPGVPPLGKNNIYVNRASAEQKLRRLTQRRHIPVIWGDYGVGKTSLVKRFFAPQNEAGREIYFGSTAGIELSDIFREILQHLNYTVETTKVTTNETSRSLGVSLRAAKASDSRKTGTATTHELVVSSPTDNSISKLASDAGLVIILDEMHRASDSLRASLADWIKSTRAANSDFALAIVGTTADVQSLVSFDQGINRHVKELHVEPMTDPEARKVVTEGFSKLKMTLPPAVRETLVSAAGGAPSVIQAFCLDAAEAAIEAGRQSLLTDDLRYAVDRYLEENEDRLLQKYMAAIETTGSKRLRTRVLHAVADSTHNIVTMEDIAEGVSKALGEPTPSTSLSGPLRALKSDDYGKILRDVTRSSSDNRVHNLSAFSDPIMKSFVKLMHNLEQNNLAP
ncbi:ATP-binding protein [Brachybacterium conglomeratum]|uniref:ATP-binding protein n=1 Tax=Brachybacterium conglomeratum TaxID=47846 RepID=UPI003DA0700F